MHLPKILSDISKIKGKAVKNTNKINRRKFLKLTAAGAATTGVAALMVYSDGWFTTTDNFGKISETSTRDTKKAFAKCGACSHTFFYLLNLEFGYPKEIEEHASDPLAGGLMMTQNQCGMLWGATLAVGAESFRRNNDRDQAIAVAVKATQHLVDSMSKRTKSVNCLDIIGCDISNKFNIVKFMLKSLPGGFSNTVCMNLAEKWAPEAFQSAQKGLSNKQPILSQPPMCCTCEVAKRMGASNEEITEVAGFAGGIGLSGNACGALGAAIWLNTLAWCRKNPGQSGYLNPNSEELLKTFYSATDSEILCRKISGKHFENLSDHTKYIKNGGCNKLINELVTNYQMI